MRIDCKDMFHEQTSYVLFLSAFVEGKAIRGEKRVIMEAGGIAR